jgi:hypothetical protein
MPLNHSMNDITMKQAHNVGSVSRHASIPNPKKNTDSVIMILKYIEYFMVYNF